LQFNASPVIVYVDVRLSPALGTPIKRADTVFVIAHCHDR
jgi:hypothetical protein